MLRALGNRADRLRRRPRTSTSASMADPAEAFHLYRQGRSQRARTLNSLLIPLNDDYTIPLRRAPDIRQACVEAYGPAETASVTSLRALLGVIGAHEWRTKGIEIPEAGGRIHPHFGVFAPIRREFGVERRGQHIFLTDHDGVSITIGEYFDIVAGALDPRSANKNPRKRPLAQGLNRKRHRSRSARAGVCE